MAQNYGWTKVGNNSRVKAHANSGDLTYNGYLCGGTPSCCNKYINVSYDVELEPWNTSEISIIKGGSVSSCTKDALVMWFDLPDSPTGSIDVMTNAFDKYCQVKNVDDCVRIIAKSDDALTNAPEMYTFNNTETFSTTAYTDSGYPCILIDPSNPTSGKKYESDTTYPLHKIAYHISSKTSATAGVTVPNNCFEYKLPKLKELYFPSNDNDTYNVISIGDSAFKDNDALTAVTFGAVQHISPRAFQGCSNLTVVDFGRSSSGSSSSNCNVRKITYIGDYAFGDCHNLLAADLSKLPINESSGGRICDNAFNGCTRLRTLKLPEHTGYTTVSANTFFNCVSLTSITIPTNVQKIEGEAFASEGITSSSVENIYISGITSNTASIHNTSFSGSRGLEHVHILSTTNLRNANGCFKKSACNYRVPSLSVTINGDVVNTTLYGAFGRGERIDFYLSNPSLIRGYQEMYGAAPSWTFQVEG